MIPWKTKAWLCALTILVSLYVLLPTFLHANERREALRATKQEIPLYLQLLPEKELTLGLDLQGGIYVELVVELDEAIRRRTDILGNEIKRELEQEKATVTSVTQPSLGTLQFQLGSAADVATLDGLINRYYRQHFVSTPRDATATQVPLQLTEQYRQDLIANVLEQATESVRNRINRYGVGEPDIRRQGEDRIAIELPGLKDPDRALDLIKRTGQLELRMVHAVDSEPALKAQQQQWALEVARVRQEQGLAADDYRYETTQKINELLKDKLPEHTVLVFELQRNPQTKEVTDAVPFLLTDKAEISGDMLTDAQVRIYENQPRVTFELNPEGTKLFADLTKQNVNHYLAILLDGTVMSAPSINEPILQGSGEITLGRGSFDFDRQQREAHDLALILQEGALPATLNEVEGAKSVIGPTLGAELIRLGFRATWLGSLCVLIFMLVYYRLSGLLANLAVILNVVFLMAILTLFNATLTLTGIAGIVLTIGMAVDANVIINERIREELRAGKDPKSAIAIGYANAKRAVIDSNITTLIAGVVLYQFGTKTIQGFAVTLCVGIMTTLITAVWFTKFVFDYFTSNRKLARLSI